MLTEWQCCAGFSWTYVRLLLTLEMTKKQNVAYSSIDVRRGTKETVEIEEPLEVQLPILEGPHVGRKSSQVNSWILC